MASSRTLSDGEYLLEVEKDPDATFQPHVNDAVAKRMRDMGASSDAPADDDEDFETALSARMAAMAATENDAGCDDGVVEPLVEASMPPVVADAPVGNDVEAVKDEWSRIPGRVTVKYNVEEGETITRPTAHSRRACRSRRASHTTPARRRAVDARDRRGPRDLVRVLRTRSGRG